MCMVIGVDGHGRVATAHQIAPVTHRRRRRASAAVLSGALSLEGLAPRSQSDMGIAQRRKSDRGTPHKVASATICSAGHSHGPVALELCQTLARRARRNEVTRFVYYITSADRHVEMASPRAWFFRSSGPPELNFRAWGSCVPPGPPVIRPRQTGHCVVFACNECALAAAAGVLNGSAKWRRWRLLQCCCWPRPGEHGSPAQSSMASVRTGRTVEHRLEHRRGAPTETRVAREGRPWW